MKYLRSRSISQSKAHKLCLLIALVITYGDTEPMRGQEATRMLTNAELNIQKLFIEANQEKLLGSYEDAASLYLEVLELDPRNDAAEYELARVYEAMDEHDKALEYIEKAIRSSPESQWYHVMKGDILEGMEEYQAAITIYEHLINLNPKEGYYYEHLVGLLKKVNQLEKALDILNQHEQISGPIPDLIYEKADICNVLGNPGKGIAELEKLIRLYPKETKHLHRIATQCVLSGDTSRAQMYYQRILEIDPQDSKANLALAKVYKSSGDDLTYLRSIAPLIANPAVQLDAKIIELIPFVEKYAADPSVSFGPELGAILEQMVAQYPNAAKAHAIYADYLYGSGKYSLARQEYEQTLALDKSVFAVWEQLLYLKLAQRDIDGVLRTAEQALDVFPNQASVYYLKGMAMAAKQDYQGAGASLQQGLIMSGRNAELQFQILTLLGSIYQETGEPDKSFSAYTKAIALKPNDAQTLNKYAYVLATNNSSLETAKEMALKAIKIMPDDPDIEHTLSRIAFQQNDLKTAREYIEKAMDHGAGDRYKALEHYGDILYSSGEIDEAVEYWQLSRNSGNPSEILRRKIAERRIIH